MYKTTNEEMKVFHIVRFNKTCWIKTLHFWFTIIQISKWSAFLLCHLHAQMRSKVKVLVYRKIAVSTKGRLRGFCDKIKGYLLEKKKTDWKMREPLGSVKPIFCKFRRHQLPLRCKALSMKVMTTCVRCHMYRMCLVNWWVMTIF